MRLRAALSLMVLPWLAACNIVVTKTPLFAPADEAGAPAMKPGVWAFEDRDCAYDEKKPLVEWPDCGGGAVVSPGAISGHDKKEGKDVWESMPFTLAAGQPRIAQVMFQTIATTGPNSSSGKVGDSPWGYAGVRAEASDPQGRITRITYWLVQCGPPPPPSKDLQHMALGTRHPLPGMVMKKGDPVCTTASKDALRGAAKASEAWGDKPMHAHWVRVAGPGDTAP